MCGVDRCKNGIVDVKYFYYPIFKCKSAEKEHRQIKYKIDKELFINFILIISIHDYVKMRTQPSKLASYYLLT